MTAEHVLPLGPSLCVDVVAVISPAAHPYDGFDCLFQISLARQCDGGVCYLCQLPSLDVNRDGHFTVL